MDHIYIKENPQLQTDVLMTGKHPEYTGHWVAQEVNGQGVQFNKVDVETIPLLKAWLMAIRAISLTATFMPALTVILWLLILDADIYWFTSICAITGLVFLQIAVNLFNDVGDYLKLIDLPTSLGGSGVIQRGWLTTQQVNQAGWMSLLVGCLFGVPALVIAPVEVLMCGLLAVVGVVGYSGKPFNFKYKALGDISVFALCGPILTVGMSYAATGVLYEGILLIGAYFGFAAAAILNANNMNDIEVDTSRGASTLASVLGFKVARRWQLGYYICAFLCLIMLMDVYFSLYFLLPFMAVVLVYKQMMKLNKTNDSSDESLAEVRFDAAKLHLLMGLLLSMVFLLITVVQ